MLRDFSEQVHTSFRVKFCLDTNILVYYLDNEYPSLNKGIDFLVQANAFVDLVTTRYILFELLEVRKRKHFADHISAFLANGQAYKKNIKYYIFKMFFATPKLYLRIIKTSETSKAWYIRRMRSCEIKHPISENNIRTFNFPETPNFYYSLLPQLKQTILDELDSIKNNTDIRVSGDIHGSLWAPTENICLSSRLNREDSLVMTSFLMPDQLVIEDFVTILTNDENFNKFVYEAPNFDAVFAGHSLRKPLISYIQRLINFDKRQFNLTVQNTDNELSDFLISYISKLIIEKNKHLYLGKTDPKKAGKDPHIIGLRLYENSTINNTNYLVVVSKKLDFVFYCPIIITDYRGATGSLAFPISGIERVVFRWPDFDAADPLKARENEILGLIKQPGNLVFIHPDSYSPIP
jgi:hypothetical protein